MNALSNESPAPRRAETGNDDGAARYSSFDMR